MAGRRIAFGNVDALRESMSRWAEDSYMRSRGYLHGAGAIDVPIDLYDTGDGYVLRALLAGAQAGDVEITLLGDTVQLRGAIHMHQADPQQDVSWLVHEVPHGSFSRLVTLPQRADADRATATFDAGILTLRLPKAEESRARQIKVSF